LSFAYSAFLLFHRWNGFRGLSFYGFTLAVRDPCPDLVGNFYGLSQKKKKIPGAAAPLLFPLCFFWEWFIFSDRTVFLALSRPGSFWRRTFLFILSAV